MSVSAGKVTGPNNGLVDNDQDRGKTYTANYGKDQRSTGKVGSPSTKDNSNAPDANTRISRDPRLA